MKRTKLIVFTLSMPNCASWNGKWSGAGRNYAIVRSARNLKADEILSKGSFYYRWSDGWGASVRVQEITPQDARRVRKQSEGFCGYDWMVDSIERFGKIYADHEIPEESKILTTESP